MTLSMFTITPQNGWVYRIRNSWELNKVVKPFICAILIYAKSIFCKVQTLSYQLPLYRYQHLHSNVLNLTMIQSTSYIGFKTLLSHAWHSCNRQRHITWLTKLYSRSKNNIWILIHTTWILRIEEFKSYLSD